MTMSMPEVLRAVVLSGGHNRRMGYLAPKATLPVVNQPNLLRTMEGLEEEGVKDFYINSHHGSVFDVARQKEVLRKIKVHSHLEPYPTGTATVTNYFAETFGFERHEPFLVVAADISHPTMNFAKFVSSFYQAKLKHMQIAGSVGFLIRPFEEVINRYPVAIINENNLVTSLEERPRNITEAFTMFHKIKCKIVRDVSRKIGVPCLPVNSSYYILLRELFDMVPPPDSGPEEAYDFGRLIFKLIPPEKLYAYFIHEALVRDEKDQLCVQREWIDMATPTDFWLANYLFLHTAPQRLHGYYDRERNLSYGENVVISPRAQVHDCVIGSHVIIGARSRMSDCIIGDFAEIDNVKMEKTVLLNHVNFKPKKRALVAESIIGGHRPFSLRGSLETMEFNRNLLTILEGGDLVVQGLNIGPYESWIAENALKKLKFSFLGIDT